MCKRVRLWFCFLFAGTLFTLQAEDGFQVTVSPGGYAWAVFSDSSGFSDFETVNTIVPGPLYRFNSTLPEQAIEAIQLSAEWLRADLAVKFTDLLYQDVYTEIPVKPAFACVNHDDLYDLVLVSKSAVRVFLAPNWLETDEFNYSEEQKYSWDIDGNGTSDSSYFSDTGVLTLCCGDSILQETEGFHVSGVTGTALGRMDGDDLADLVVTTEAGNVLVYRNRGTALVPCYLPYFSEHRTAFPMNPGAFSSPALYSSSDSSLVLAVGTRQNGLIFYSSASGSKYNLRDWVTLNTVNSDNRYMNISSVAVDRGGETVLICATRDGILYEGRSDSDSLAVLDLPPVPGTYPNLALAFAGQDEFPDLIAGTMEGNVYSLSGKDGWFHSNWTAIDGIPLIPSGAPASWGNRLVFGSADGTLRCFIQGRRGVWTEDIEGVEFSGIDVGDYSTPLFFDMNNDGTEELIVGDGTGSLTLFETGADSSSFFESYSWKFQPNNGVASVESYYSQYFTPYQVFRSPSEVATVNAFANEIISANSHLRDEIAYCVANSLTGILRSMVDNGDEDIFCINAESLYSMADKMSYVRLLDTEQGTLCELKTEDGWFQISRENYYHFIVQPRVLFEIPARIDATYWNTPCDTLTTPMVEYLNYKPDSVFGNSPDHVFWRQFIPSDSSRGRTLEESMMCAETYQEAVIRLCNFQSHSQPEGLMSFGYMTNDIQPMEIYSKAYGSCGEQSILQTALCRAFFIPAYVVGCRGEDHQWNHYLDPKKDKWNHWDINYGISGIGNLWVSGEGDNHQGKTISTIIAFDPAGPVWPVTATVLVPEGSGYMEGDSGYTRTADVSIQVTDPDGVPVSGAMVMARSHWENANSVTAFDYTDPYGICVFDLGWEPNGGYTIDIISPFGSAGSSNVGFTEDSTYSLTYTVPYRIPRRQEVFLSDSHSPQVLPVLEKFYPVPYFYRSLYSIDSASEDFLRSRDWIFWREKHSSSNLMYMDGNNFDDYKKGFNCNAVGSPFIPGAGDSCFAVLDNRNSMFVWREYSVPSSADVTDAPEWLTNYRDNRVPIAGSCIPDNRIDSTSGNSQWIRNYLDISIQQDNPDDPLASNLIIGPFNIPSGERSLSIGASSEQPGLDLDLFLFQDRNGNRAVDGMDELLSKSTTPTSSEKISIYDPDTSAVYWIYIHGWKVEEDQGIIQLGLSFEPEMQTVHSLIPTGYQSLIPQDFSFAIITDSLETGDVFLQSGESVIFPEKKTDSWYFEVTSPEEFFTDNPMNLFLKNGELAENFQWNISLDSIPPEILIHSLEVDSSTMQTFLEVVSTDELSGVKEVQFSIDSTETIKLRSREDSLWDQDVDLLAFAGKTVSIEICAVDSAGNETKETHVTAIPERPEVVFSFVYPSKSVYDHTPVLQVYTDFKNSVTGWTAVAELSGDQVLHSVIDGNIIQFPVDEYLSDGEYSATVKIFTVDGELAGEHSWSFEIETMTITR